MFEGLELTCDDNKKKSGNICSDLWKNGFSMKFAVGLPQFFS